MDTVESSELCFQIEDQVGQSLGPTIDPATEPLPDISHQSRSSCRVTKPLRNNDSLEGNIAFGYVASKAIYDVVAK